MSKTQPLALKKISPNFPALLTPEQATISQNPGAAEGQVLEALHGKCQVALRQMVVLGLYAYAIKATQPYGMFGLWLHKHAPSLARASGKRAGAWRPTSALGGYMECAKNAMQAIGIKMEEWFPGLDAKQNKKGVKLLDAPWTPHQLLLFSDEELDASGKTNRQKLCELLEGKNAKAFKGEFVNFKADVGGEQLNDDDVVPATGAGTYHAKRKDGSDRLPKRSREQKLIDEAEAAAPGWLLALRKFVLPDTKNKLLLLSAVRREELKLAAFDAYQILLEASKLP